METNNAANSNSSATTDPATRDMKLEVIVIPVADVDRAREFYVSLGWWLDVTPPFVVQLTPPGSECSVQFGANWSTAAPGSAKAFLTVNDIVTTRDALVAAGVEVGLYHLEPEGPVSGPDHERRTYRSFGSFKDPEGNEWVLQEITARMKARTASTIGGTGTHPT